MTETTITPTERDEARAELRKLLPVGSTVYVIQRSVSSTGMSRHLSLFVKGRDGLRNITWLAARAMGERVHESTGYQTIRVTGCGMDMHFHTVYSLARAIRPQGHRCTGKDNGPRRCPSNDHSNDYARLARDFDASHDEAANELSRDEYVAARRAWIAAQVTYYPQRRHADAGYSLNYRTI